MQTGYRIPRPQVEAPAPLRLPERGQRQRWCKGLAHLIWLSHDTRAEGVAGTASRRRLDERLVVAAAGRDGSR